MKIIKPENYIYPLLLVFFLINLSFLVNFPFVHSDEIWLSGLTKTIMTEGHLALTEPFFDLYPRSPHALRTVFNILQMPFIKLLGYRVLSVRLLSLLCGTVALFFFYKLNLLLTDSFLISFLGAILLGIDIQFIYASHFARQEIILVLIMLAALYYYFSLYKFQPRITQDLLIGLILISGIGIHPNSFTIALPFVFIYCYHLIISKKIKLVNFIVFIGTLAAGALLFVFLSLSFDPDFLTNYASYGRTLGVLSPLPLKIERLIGFYRKLFYAVSGTYYTPVIKIQFFIFIFTAILAVYKSLLHSGKYRELLITFLAINIGYIAIGRYNQTGIIFIFPVLYLLLIFSINNLIDHKNIKYTLLIILIIAISVNTGLNLWQDIDYDYQPYIKEISRALNSNDTVLANLNTGFYFNLQNLYDYRNLAHLQEHNLAFADYIEKNGIEYIVYPEEMDFIYNTRPVWNIIYGNLTPYYKDMQQFLTNECQLIYRFTNPGYPMRIVRYRGEKNWEVKIYKVR